MEHAGENEQQAQAVSPSSQVTDEALTDQVSDELAVSLESSAGGQELIDPTQEVVLEEEKVKAVPRCPSGSAHKFPGFPA